jgi:hypothetical protein
VAEGGKKLYILVVVAKADNIATDLQIYSFQSSICV